jgi:hypothetical protein
MVKINWPNHEKFDYLCAEKPTDLKPLGEVVEKALIPYGCTLLRMTVMPNICR